MLITCLPYLFGLALSTPEQQFSGFILGIEDANSYLAKMRLGAEGGWLFYLPYTPEPHNGAYLFTFHLLLGKISRWSGLAPSLTYHLARLIFSLGLLFTIYIFIAYFIPDIVRRRLAFLLVGLGSGLGWLLTLTGLAARLGLPLDLYVPEGFVFLVLLHLPHVALAESLLFWGILLTLHSWQTNRWVFTLWAGCALLVMTLIAAFYIAVFAAVLGVTWLILLIRIGPKFQVWRTLAKIIIPILMTAPVLLYDAYTFITNPIFAVWNQQNIILSPPIWHYGFAYGLLLIPAIYGVRQSFAQAEPLKRWLLVVWCLIFPILVYLPFNLQRRLVVGVQVPLAILATSGFFALYQKFIPPHRHTLARNLTIFSFSLTNLLLLLGSFLIILGQSPPLFHPTAHLEAMHWLAARSQGEVVIAAYDTGNLLPAYANVRAFVGHGPETIYSGAKQAQVEQFFSDAVADTWRLNLLHHFNVRYVYYGPNERALGDFSPQEALYLQEIYQQDGIQIFRVTF